MSPVDASDVQGLAAFGYGNLVEARYFLVRVRDPVAARAWIASAPVSTAEYRQPAPSAALQLGFTRRGLRALGSPEDALGGFSAEFLTGMAGEVNRSRRLGDTGESDPSQWVWGGPSGEPDAVLMFFAIAGLDAWIQTVQKDPWHAAFEIMTTLETSDMGDHEPFGFADGISQPDFDWKRERTAPGTTVAYDNEVAIGELLLGYPNEYGKYTDRPLIALSADPTNCLVPAEDNPALKDFGRNGTYLVLRQLEQDVRGFWQYLDRAAGGNAQERYRLGAAMVGRTVDGDPLIKGPSPNTFTYDGDPGGTQCPFGAHIRRANPRNADFFGNPAGLIAQTAARLGIPTPRYHDDLIASTRFHRILRRGREYGIKLAPEDALQSAPPNDSPRGLQFACLCANISRQFEFVQNAWLMSTKFGGLSEESDPLLGNRAPVGNCPADNFSIPREGKLARRLAGLPRFITVKGGAYFFMPSRRALRYIASNGSTTSNH